MPEHSTERTVTLEEAIELAIRETANSMRDVRVSVPFEDMALVDHKRIPRLAVSDVARIAAEVCRKVGDTDAPLATGETDDE